MGRFSIGSLNPINRVKSIGEHAIHGDVKGLAEDAANSATMGGYGVAKSAGAAALGGVSDGANALVDGYNAPYNEAKTANQKAAGDMRTLGSTALGMNEDTTDRALDQTTPGARAWSGAYEGNGALAGAGQLEKLYSDRQNGDDVTANQQRAVGTQQINDGMAARGLQNSGAAMKAIGNMNAQVTSDSEQRMEGLASAAQGATQSRVNGGIDRLTQMGNSRAGIIQGGMQPGINAYQSGQMGGIQGDLANAGVDMSKRKDLLGFGSQVLGTVGGGLLAGA